MRQVSAATTDAWKSEDKTGPRRPVVRATVAKTLLRRHDYDTALMPGGEWEPEKHRIGHFTSLLFGALDEPQEIPNISEFTWSRSVNQDVAEATLTLLNAAPQPIGQAATGVHEDDFERPGWLTYNRGDATEAATRWGYTETGWNGMLVPDRIVRTYEGYGFDDTVVPARDPNLMQSGTWMIDEVTYDTKGTITVKMRDVGRLLLDQMVFPPAIPAAEYPIEWDAIRTEKVPGRTAKGGSWTELKGIGTASSSNDAYIGKGLTDDPLSAYVTANGGVNGHHASYVLENASGDHWLSTGQTTARSKVWWQVDLNDAVPLAGLRIHPQGGPYRVYISIHNGTKWVGKRKIPYTVTTGGVDVKADIPFVHSVVADRGLSFEVILKRVYPNAKKIRLTFTNLRDFKLGSYPYRAALNDLMIYTAPNATDLSFGQGSFQKVVGNYSDYTQIVKWTAAWAGFFWPPHDTGQDFQMVGPGDKVDITFADRDHRLPKGRVWGNFQRTNTVGKATLTLDLFDKQPMMDMISYVRDLTGFSFWIDETGGIVWRYPNVRSIGNYLTDPGQLGPRSVTRTANVIEIDEYETLVDYSTTLSSRNMRERVFVADTTGKIGTVARGFNPYPQKLRRMAGWTDQQFGQEYGQEEAEVMADMIIARQMYDYRRGKVRIPGHPGIQIDDQVRLWERVTGETFYHYVETIESTINMETGEYYYDLGTHWLGEDPADIWVVKVDEMKLATQQYLNTLGPVDD